MIAVVYIVVLRYFQTTIYEPNFLAIG